MSVQPDKDAISPEFAIQFLPFPAALLNAQLEVVGGNDALMSFMGWESVPESPRIEVDRLFTGEVNHELKLRVSILGKQRSAMAHHVEVYDAAHDQKYDATAHLTMPFSTNGDELRFLIIAPRVKVERIDEDLEFRISEAFFEYNPYAISLWSADGAFEKTNKKYEETFGFSLPEGCTLYDDRDLDKYGWLDEKGKLRDEVLRCENVFDYDDLVPGCNKGTLYVNMTCFPLRDANGVIRKRVVMYENITERRKAEMALRERESQLSQMQRMDALGRMAGGVAHDFGNMLTVIKFAAARGLNNPTVKLMERIDKATDRASNLTRQLLSISRREPTEAVLTPLNELVRNVAELCERVISDDVKIELSLEEPQDRVRIDSGQIEQALINLLINADHAIENGGIIKVKTYREAHKEPFSANDILVKPGEYHILEVSDNGSGIEEEHLKRIFEPFFSTKSEGKGTGLGLAVVHGTMQRHGGYVTVESELDEGSTFRLYFPRALQTTDSGETAKVVKKKKKPDSEKFKRWPLSVYVVDDQEEVREAIAESIVAMEHELAGVGTIGDAFRYFEKNARNVDVVLSDVVMPMMSGPELIQRLRQIRPGLPVIFMSGYPDTELQDSTESVLTEAPFLLKPFSPDELRDALKAIYENN